MVDPVRRKFIINNIKTTGAIIVATTSGKDLVMPQTIEATAVQFPESICNSKNSDNQKIFRQITTINLHRTSPIMLQVSHKRIL